jgi:hypothetical protein
MLLEADIDSPKPKVEPPLDGELSEQEEENLRRLRGSRQSSILSFDVFLLQYWNHFPQDLLKGQGSLVHVQHAIILTLVADPMIVFSDIVGELCSGLWRRCYSYRSAQGVIKGSESALADPSGRLDLNTYMKLDRRGSSALALNKTYKTFEIYERRRRLLGHTDAADRSALLPFDAAK